MDKEGSSNLVQSKMRKNIDPIKHIGIIIGCIFLGIPFGIFVGIMATFKFPFAVYNTCIQKDRQARLEEAKQFLDENSGGDIWEKHINRMNNKN